GSGQARFTRRHQGKIKGTNFMRTTRLFCTVAVLILCQAIPALAETAPDAERLVKAVDANMTFDTRIALVDMVVQGPTGEQRQTLKIYSQGWDKVFLRVEDSAGAAGLKPGNPVPGTDEPWLNDVGSQFLKIGQDLWGFFPRIQKLVRMAGRQLRENMLGSDLSYQELLESRRFRDLYDAAIDGQDTVAGEPCEVLELLARAKGLPCAKIKLWVSDALKVPFREERYASSGRLLKAVTYADVRQFGARFYPTRMVVQDKLRSGTATTLVFKELTFSEPLPVKIFDPRAIK